MILFDQELPFPFEGEYRLSQGFGSRPEFYARWGLQGHNGVDFALPVGTPVLAIGDGKVLQCKYDTDGYGIYVKIRHAWGMSLYAHLSQHRVWLGAPVKTGQVLGLSGNTGASSGPHLHFGLSLYPTTRDNGYNGYVNPVDYLRKPGMSAGPLDGFVAPVAAMESPGDTETMGHRDAETQGGPFAFGWYQQAALRTWNPTDDEKGDAAYLGLSLSGEAGELANLVKKYWRHGHPLNKEKVKEEAGDVLWYLAVLCAAFDIDLGEVAQDNITKLLDRYPEGFSQERSRNRAEG